MRKIEMKNIFISLLLVICLFAFAGCSSDEKTSSGGASQNGDSITEDASQKELSVDENGAYMIYNAEDLVLYRDLFDQAAKENFDGGNGSTLVDFPGAILMDDIDLSEVCGPDVGNWKPIGRDAYVSTKDEKAKNVSYSSVFDGNGHTISNLYIKDSEKGGALFQRIWEGTVTNLTISDSTVSCIAEDDREMDAASIATYVTDGLIENCETTDSVIVESSSCAGGLIAKAEEWNYAVEITNCKNRAKINSNNVAGGIIGSASGPVYIFGCENYGNITGSEEGNRRRLGGIAGVHGGSNNYDGCIMGCINYGDITETVESTEYCGGIVGYNGSTIRYCVNAGTVTSAYAAYDITFPEEASCYYNLNVGTVVTDLDAEFAYTTADRYDRGQNYSFSDSALTDGTALAALIEECGNHWVQGESFPVWSSERSEEYQDIITSDAN